VHALDGEQAKATVLHELAEELKPRLLNDPFDLPEMMVNEVIEISLTEIDTIPNAGFTWYREDTSPPN